MGLDQYAYSRDSEGEDTEIKTWRKHNALQGWMEKLWGIKTGEPEKELNCSLIELTTQDLDQLWKSVSNGTLPETQGFFYGCDTSKDDTQKNGDLQFITEARSEIKDGKKVFYSCWY
jgi:hypothetical protein